MQRMQARDFYDIWYLLEIHEMDVDFYLAEFRNKCESKDIDPMIFKVSLSSAYHNTKDGGKHLWQIRLKICPILTRWNVK